MQNLTIASNEVTELVTGLNRLARNLWWTWNQEAQEIFQQLSPRGWQNLYHNAVAVLHEVTDYELRVHLQDPEFASRVRPRSSSMEKNGPSTTRPPYETAVSDRDGHARAKRATRHAARAPLQEEPWPAVQA